MQTLKCACHLISRDSSGTTGQIEGLITTHQKKYIMKEKVRGNENKEREGKRKRNTDKLAARILLINPHIKSFTTQHSTPALHCHS
jgi:hypothetical protein